MITHRGFLTKNLLKQFVVAKISKLLLSKLPIYRGSLPDLKRLDFQVMQLRCNQVLLKSPGLEQTFNPPQSLVRRGSQAKGIFRTSREGDQVG
jgi:hypothetical protein